MTAEGRKNLHLFSFFRLSIFVKLVVTIRVNLFVLVWTKSYQTTWHVGTVCVDQKRRNKCQIPFVSYAFKLRSNCSQNNPKRKLKIPQNNIFASFMAVYTLAKRWRSSDHLSSLLNRIFSFDNSSFELHCVSFCLYMLFWIVFINMFFMKNISK